MDISFDLSLIDKYGVTVQAFDPTPKSIAWVKSQKLPEKFCLHEIGISHYNGVARFFPPNNPNYVSHSVYQHAGVLEQSIEVPVQRLSKIMEMLGNRSIDVLKIDIEGAEYDVLQDIINAGIDIKQLLVEFHHRFKNISVAQTKSAIQLLNAHNYKIFHASKSGEEYAFIRI